MNSEEPEPEPDFSEFEKMSFVECVSHMLDAEKIETLDKIREVKILCELIVKSDHSEENKEKLFAILNMVVNLANECIKDFRGGKSST